MQSRKRKEVMTFDEHYIEKILNTHGIGIRSEIDSEWSENLALTINTIYSPPPLSPSRIKV